MPLREWRRHKAALQQWRQRKRRRDEAEELAAPAPDAITTSATGLSTSDNAVYYNGIFSVANPDHQLRIAMTAQVSLLLGDAKNRALIRAHYPKPSVTRRNTGYALDRLMECSVFNPASTQPFNLCQLLAGSEGTLFLGVEFELNVEPLPPPGALMCAHFASLEDALHATLRCRGEVTEVFEDGGETRARIAIGVWTDADVQTLDGEAIVAIA